MRLRVRPAEASPEDLEGVPGRRLRKRKVHQHSDDCEAALEQLLEVAARAEKIVVFSGSGLSASSGMSTFSTRGGLYERAQKKYKLADGKMLFTYAFFDRQRPEAQAFFADIYTEALVAEPAVGHHALQELFDAGRLHRHYTLNIDGLAEQVGMDTWHHEHNSAGVTVEMHGNVHHLVCPECHATAPMNPALAKQIRAKIPVPCTAPGCGQGTMRFKVMMYDDGEAECITPDDVMDLMEEDVKAADLVLWVGISFQQSASTVYFRKARCWIQEAGRLDSAVQALINPSDEALFNLRTAMSNQSELRVLEVLAESDEVLPLLAERLGVGAGGGDAVAAALSRARAAAAAAAAHRAKLEEQQRLAAALGAAGYPGVVGLAADVLASAASPAALASTLASPVKQEDGLQPAGLPSLPLPLSPALGQGPAAAALPASLDMSVQLPAALLQQAAAQHPLQAQPAPPLAQQHQATLHTLDVVQNALREAMQFQLSATAAIGLLQQQQVEQQQLEAQQAQEQLEQQQQQAAAQQQAQQQQLAALPLLAQLLGSLQASPAGPGHQHSGATQALLQQQQAAAVALATCATALAPADATAQPAVKGEQLPGDAAGQPLNREESPQGVVLQHQDSQNSEQHQAAPTHAEQAGAPGPVAGAPAPGAAAVRTVEDGEAAVPLEAKTGPGHPPASAAALP